MSNEANSNSNATIGELIQVQRTPINADVKPKGKIDPALTLFSSFSAMGYALGEADITTGSAVLYLRARCKGKVKLEDLTPKHEFAVEVRQGIENRYAKNIADRFYVRSDNGKYSVITAEQAAHKANVVKVTALECVRMPKVDYLALKDSDSGKHAIVKELRELLSERANARWHQLVKAAKNAPVALGNGDHLPGQGKGNGKAGTSTKTFIERVSKFMADLPKQGRNARKRSDATVCDGPTLQAAIAKFLESITVVKH